MPNKSGKFLVIDTETTGLHSATYGLIQVGAIATNSKLEIIDTFTTDVCPPAGSYKISKEANKIHGFTQKRIDKGVSYKDFCELFLKFVRKNFKNQPIAVGQFYPFDYAFLDYVFSINGYGDVMNKEVLTNQFIDTKALVLSLNLKAELENKPVPFPITSLSKVGGLKDTLNISKDTIAHDALGDCVATLEVLKKLMEYLK